MTRTTRTGLHTLLAPHRDQRGQSLVIVLSLITILFLLGSALAVHASAALRATRASADQGNDFYAADGGAELGMWWQRNGMSGNPPDQTLNGITTTTTVSTAAATIGLGTNSGNSGANATAHTINLPTGITAGDLLLVAFANDGSGSQGPNFAASGTTVAGPAPETAEAWVTPGNIGSDNGVEATITASSYDSPDVSQRLTAKNFGFTIPATATIDGITVEIDRRAFAGTAKDYRVQLLDAAGAPVGDNKADTVNNWVAGIKSYGGVADKWNATPTPAMVNDADFGVVLAAQATSANADVGVDFIRITVEYTPTPATASVTTPATGWTELFTQPTAGNLARLTVFYRWAAGGEAGTITVTTTASEGSAHASYRISGVNPASNPTNGTAATGTSTAPNPPSLDPAGWGTEDTLWIAVTGWDGNTAASAYPTSYTLANLTNRWASSNGVGVAVAARQLNAPSDDPATFTIGASQSWAANTIAVRPQVPNVTVVASAGGSIVTAVYPDAGASPPVLSTWTVTR